MLFISGIILTFLLVIGFFVLVDNKEMVSRKVFYIGSFLFSISITGAFVMSMIEMANMMRF